MIPPTLHRLTTTSSTDCPVNPVCNYRPLDVIPPPPTLPFSSSPIVTPLRCFAADSSCESPLVVDTSTPFLCSLPTVCFLPPLAALPLPCLFASHVPTATTTTTTTTTATATTTTTTAVPLDSLLLPNEKYDSEVCGWSPLARRGSPPSYYHLDLAERLPPLQYYASAGCYLPPTAAIGDEMGEKKGFNFAVPFGLPDGRFSSTFSSSSFENISSSSDVSSALSPGGVSCACTSCWYAELDALQLPPLAEPLTDRERQPY